MASTLEAASSPLPLNNKESPLLSPSDKQFWSAFHQRIESRKAHLLSDQRKDDSLMLIKGFDSVANSLSILTANLQTALQGAREVAKTSPLTDVDTETEIETKTVGDIKQEENSSDEDDKKGTKRKLDTQDCPHNEEEIPDNSKKQKHQVELNHLKKLRNLAVALATKSASLARELRSVKSEMCFLQEKCALLEEKNQRLQDRSSDGVNPDEDDLVRLQLEALLSEKSRLATENANLTRENQCLRQLVEYHQFASEDLSASYEQVIQGICLDFSSPIAQDAEENVEGSETHTASKEAFAFEFATCLDTHFASNE